MIDYEKEKMIVGLLHDKGLRPGEGKQRLAHAMLAPIRKNISGEAQKEFVYKKLEKGDEERAYANTLRYMATEPGVSPGIADMYNRMADSWDAYAKVPKWKRNLFEIINRLFGHGC